MNGAVPLAAGAVPIFGRLGLNSLRAMGIGDGAVPKGCHPVPPCRASRRVRPFSKPTQPKTHAGIRTPRRS